MDFSLEKSFTNIKSSWFLENTLLFGVLCTHHIIPNPNISVPMRTGKLRIEYSPIVLEKIFSENNLLTSIDKEKYLEKLLKVEVLRILLGHPYNRQPVNPRPGVLLLASDVVIYQSATEEFADLSLSGVIYLKNQAVRFGMLKDPLPHKWKNSDELKFYQRNLVINPINGNLMLVDKLNFEQWYNRILFLINETSIAGENAGAGGELDGNSEEASELWEENEEIKEDINQQIKNAEADEGWGGIGGNLQRSIKDSVDFSFDYRRALAQFRQNIVNNNRYLTRMRPNRRYGFKAMGSRYQKKANLLIAVDVSGSITDDSFNHFTHAIKNFFFLGIIEKIDVIFFDVNLKNSKPVTFRKKIDLSAIKGRGGTNFQPAIDFFEENSEDYSGLIIFTDGEGNIPKISNGKKQILWILDNRLAFEKNKQWINRLPNCKSTYLPF